MRWWLFLILAYALACVQFALGGLLGWGQRTPDVLLPLVVFVALHAPRATALTAAVVAGAMHDAFAGLGIGTYVVAYALAASMAGKTRDALFVDSPLTHAVATLLSGAAIVAWLAARHAVRRRFFDDDPAIAVGASLLGALLTTLLAVPMIGLLRRGRRAFDFASR